VFEERGFALIPSPRWEGDFEAAGHGKETANGYPFLAIEGIRS